MVMMIMICYYLFLYLFLYCIFNRVKLYLLVLNLLFLL
uniref:Uncharacterized protein n=1 Tax=Anguilla anguilla TaxID=7936 RepID=A0A0E9W8J3_ANGAN